MNASVSARTWVREIVDFLLPPCCVSCTARIPSLADTGLVCDRCLTRLRRAPAPRCPRCDAPLGTGRSETRPCLDCVDWPSGLSSARCAAVLEAPASELVHALKYDGWKAVAEVMAARMAALAPGPGAGEHVVPVPTTPGRARRRGYNQAALLAEGFARRTDRRCLPLLVRRRAGGTQVSLHPAERRANVRGAFQIVSFLRGAVRDASIILVDDVLTTGATANEAARTLVDAGAARVELVAFARALPAPLA